MGDPKAKALELLYDLLDALSDAGVDVSYFPDGAYTVVDEYAGRIVSEFYDDEQT